eukprot:TRINITY_DN996_c0_g1_i1.p1 TRINITY_DN996_c0_g1~~TRINITY_DN996_c0_g1_i1.p1  ORF type:complete len:353 (+),score=75.37 TRINITY_DN996_c0_g1_i1:51-1109(+)
MFRSVCARVSRTQFGRVVRWQSTTGAPLEPRFLVTGATGQIGSELVSLLRVKYGADRVVASDVKEPPKNFSAGPFSQCDVLNMDNLARLVLENDITCIVHLASLLSAIGERNPQVAMKVNARGIENVLELAREQKLTVYAPSTIAAFGPSTPRDMTPNETIMRPTTMYGVTKVYLELLGEYYHQKYNVDFRSLRYPGVISSDTMPGGGTTDYAVEIYIEALKHGRYTCFLKEDTALPMMYMPDCLKATIKLMEAPASRLTKRVYNVTGMSFTPAQVAESIRKYIPHFEISYQPDFRQNIADTWPKSLDDSLARADWDWKPEYDLDSMTKHMLVRLCHIMPDIPPSVKAQFLK